MEDEGSGSSIEALPAELLVSLFKFLPAKDLAAAASVSSFWHAAASSNILWKQLCIDHWKIWQTAPDDTTMDWKDIFKDRANKDMQVPQLLEQMCNPFTRREALENAVALGMDIWERLLSMILEMEKVPQQHVTRLYRANHCLKKIREEALTREWRSLLDRINDPTQSAQVGVEEGALLIASWEYWRDLSLPQKVKTTLDGYAAKVRQRLEEQFPCSYTVDDETPPPWSAKDVLMAVNIFFKESKFKGNKLAYYDPKNSFLNDVLERKTGIPISLSTIHAAVCRRLGVETELIGMPGHFLLRLKDSGEDGVYIDAFHKGRLLSQEDCLGMMQSMFGVASATYLAPIQLASFYERMLANLFGIYQRDEKKQEELLGILKQQAILNPALLDDRRQLELRGFLHFLRKEYDDAKIFLEKLLRMAVSDSAEDKLQQIKEIYSPEPKPMGVTMKYHVGQVLVELGTGDVVVVCGWTVSSALGERSVHGQLMYEVLKDPSTDGNHFHYYLPEGRLGLGEPRPLRHPDLGLFFERYDEDTGCYIPNADLRCKYPD